MCDGSELVVGCKEEKSDAIWDHGDFDAQELAFRCLVVPIGLLCNSSPKDSSVSGMMVGPPSCARCQASDQSRQSPGTATTERRQFAARLLD